MIKQLKYQKIMTLDLMIMSAMLLGKTKQRIN